MHTHSGVPDKHMPLCNPDRLKISSLKDLPKTGQSQSRFPSHRLIKFPFIRKIAQVCTTPSSCAAAAVAQSPSKQRFLWSQILGVSSGLSNHDINLSLLLFSFGTFEVVEAATSAKVHQTNGHSQPSSGSLLNVFPEVDVNAIRTDNYDESICSRRLIGSICCFCYCYLKNQQPNFH